MLKSLLLTLALLLPLPGHSDVFVIVNAANPVRQLSSQDIAALYLGRTHTFPAGNFALIFDLPRDHPLREQFFRLMAGMSINQVNSYWSRLMFSGQETPPRILPNESTVLEIVRNNPSAIAYVGSSPKDDKIRVLLHVKE